MQILRKAGFYLEKIWETAMIRRTCVSVELADHTRKIAESLPQLYNRRVICHLAKEEQDDYDSMS